jgi:hypothetical protein
MNNYSIYQKEDKGPRPIPGTHVSYKDRGIGIVLPHKETTPQAFVRVQFRNGGEYTVRSCDLEIVES